MVWSSTANLDKTFAKDTMFVLPIHAHGLCQLLEQLQQRTLSSNTAQRILFERVLSQPQFQWPLLHSLIRC